MHSACILFCQLLITPPSWLQLLPPCAVLRLRWPCTLSLACVILHRARTRKYDWHSSISLLVPKFFELSPWTSEEEMCNTASQNFFMIKRGNVYMVWCLQYLPFDQPRPNAQAFIVFFRPWTSNVCDVWLETCCSILCNLATTCIYHYGLLILPIAATLLKKSHSHRHPLVLDHVWQILWKASYTLHFFRHSHNSKKNVNWKTSTRGKNSTQYLHLYRFI